MPKSYLGQNDIVRFLSCKNGLSEAMAKRVLHDICDALLVGLLSSEFSFAADLPRLGRFRLQSKGPRRLIEFRPSQARVDFLETSAAQQLIPETPEDQLEPDDPEANGSSSFFFEIDESALVGEAGEKLGPDYINSHASKRRVGQQSNAPDEVRTSFVNYLREEFPYGLHWTHPIVGTTFTHDLIKRRLEEYRVYNKGNYRALWC